MAIDFLYTEIGRGHPYYLDGIRECLPADVTQTVASAFSCSRGISLLGWHMAHSAYRYGSSTAGGGLYSRLRRTQKNAQGGTLMNLLVRDVRSRYTAGDSPLVVAHPLLVSALADRRSLYYQHGEVVAPPESLIKGQHSVFVPTTALADRFRDAGQPASQIIVTGLCIEPTLEQQAQRRFTERLARYDAGAPLTLALYSSGAEPLAHVKQLAGCAGALLRGGHHAIAFCRQGGRFQSKLQDLLQTAAPGTEDHLSIEPYRDRAMLHERTLARASAFDACVAPAHERTHWALGLGLPMFIVGPAIGTFAPLNRQALLRAGVARDLPEMADDGWASALNKDDMLTRMSMAGWGTYSIAGFQTIADHLQNV